MKVLIVATVVKTHINEFHLPLLKMLKEMGAETHVAARNDFEDTEDCVIPGCDFYHDIPFGRNPASPDNLKAYRMLKELIRDEDFDLVHVNTPVGAFLGRLACHQLKKEGRFHGKVFYTAHGFHFYKGAPVKNWLLYYPAERLASRWTDVLITINREDYALARGSMQAKRVVYVQGVGIDLNRFQPHRISNTQGVDQAAEITNEAATEEGKIAAESEIRQQLGFPENAIWLLNVGELIPRKNQAALIRAVAGIDKLYLTIAGRGELEEELKKLIRDLGAEDRIRLLGYRNDIDRLCQAADAFAFPSFQEGLPVAVMEAMASGLPVACSRIRGNTDLIVEGKGGVFFPSNDAEGIREGITSLLRQDLSSMGRYNRERMKKFSLTQVMARMKALYEVYWTK